MKKVYLSLGASLTLVLFIAATTYAPLSAKVAEKIAAPIAGNYISLSAQQEDCNTETYNIYPEAAKMWNASWLDVHRQDTTEAIRTLNTNDLSYLFEQYDGHPQNGRGLRFYYGLMNEDSLIPNLLILNTLNCQDKADADDMVLLITPKGSKKIPASEAKQYVKLWKDKSDANNWTSVYAYNYRWDQIKELVGEDLNSDIHIVYGLRTLSPDENKTEFQLPKTDSRTEEAIFGSIVYVNVLYIGKNDIALTNDDEQFSNFARPCPRYCDPDSTVVINNNY
ncbi:MAG: hypothetical protein HEP71_07470 [Roseivirga sp.]|nr:hypothetical protein [Roseivirga sp.]